jgi:hypothetical protein
MWQKPVATDGPTTPFSRAYFSPYLSCAECNEITFINSYAVGLAIAKGSDVESAHVECSETMPRCTGCGRTHMWVLGALNLEENVLDAKAAKKEKKKRKLRSACLIQARARGIIQRREFAIVLETHRARQRIIFHAATLLATRYRGYRARRVAEVERALNRIKVVSQPTLLEVVSSSQRRRVKRMAATHDEFPAENGQEGGTDETESNETKAEKEQKWVAEMKRKQRDAVKLFWYKRPQEIDLLYRDYQLLVERTGNRPARFLVERNIIIIAEKIFEKQQTMAARIQARTRGIFGRMLITKYRVEFAYVRRIHTASAFVIQRNFRRWLGVRERFTRISARHVGKMTEKLRLARDEQAYRDAKALAREQLLKAYQQERRLESAARMTGKVMYGACDGNRMLAFKQS